MLEHILGRFGNTDADISGNTLTMDALRRFDWASTSAGPIEQWPEPLQHAARLMLLSAVPMAVLIGEEGRVTFNSAMCDLFGSCCDDALGKSIEEIIPEAASFCREAIDRCFERNASSFRDKPLPVHRDGEWKTAWFHFAFTPIAGAEGHVSGVLLLANETTARVMALRDLQRSQERIEIALDAGGIIGTWDLDIATNRLTCDERFARLFGISAQERRAGTNKNILTDLVHLEDRARVQDTLAVTIRTGADYKCRYRIRAADGGTRWCFAAGRAMWDDNGAIAKLYGVVIDLTNQIAAEDALIPRRDTTISIRAGTSSRV